MIDNLKKDLIEIVKNDNFNDFNIFLEKFKILLDNDISEIYIDEYLLLYSYIEDFWFQKRIYINNIDKKDIEYNLRILKLIMKEYLNRSTILNNLNVFKKRKKDFFKNFIKNEDKIKKSKLQPIGFSKHIKKL